MTRVANSAFCSFGLEDYAHFSEKQLTFTKFDSRGHPYYQLVTKAARKKL